MAAPSLRAPGGWAASPEAEAAGARASWCHSASPSSVPALSSLSCSAPGVGSLTPAKDWDGGGGCFELSLTGVCGEREKIIGRKLRAFLQAYA